MDAAPGQDQRVLGAWTFTGPHLLECFCGRRRRKSVAAAEAESGHLRDIAGDYDSRRGEAPAPPTRPEPGISRGGSIAVHSAAESSLVPRRRGNGLEEPGCGQPLKARTGARRSAHLDLHG